MAFSLFTVPFPNFPLLSGVQRSEPDAWIFFQLIAGDFEVVSDQTRLLINRLLLDLFLVCQSI